MNTVLSLFLFAVAIAYFEYRLRSINKDAEDDHKGAFDFFATKEELKQEIKRLMEKAGEDKTAMEERMASLEEKAFFAAENKRKAEAAKQQAQVEDADPSVIYFRWPSDDGTFADAQRLRAQSEETYYLFRLDESRTHAEFTFVTMSDTQLSKANNSSKKYIERACNFVGAKSTQYVCTPGKAHLERGRWMIDLKARIEYK
ncbi:MAG: hypothetical protein IKI36_00080 [Prevotella sp.]|nr:hypothetical protein [Prevotella sp.]